MAKGHISQDGSHQQHKDKQKIHIYKTQNKYSGFRRRNLPACRRLLIPLPVHPKSRTLEQDQQTEFRGRHFFPLEAEVKSRRLYAGSRKRELEMNLLDSEDTGAGMKT